MNPRRGTSKIGQITLTTSNTRVNPNKNNPIACVNIAFAGIQPGIMRPKNNPRTIATVNVFRKVFRTTSRVETFRQHNAEIWGILSKLTAELVSTCGSSLALEDLHITDRRLIGELGRNFLRMNLTVLTVRKLIEEAWGRPVRTRRIVNFPVEPIERKEK